MPGAITLPTANLDLFPDLGAILRQSRHPVYNAGGKKVGSYETLDALCQGRWMLFTGEAQPPPSQIYVNDFWGRRVPLSTQCVRAARATAGTGAVAAVKRIVQPQAVAPASAAKAVADTNKAVTGSAAAINPDTLIPTGTGLNLTPDQTRLAFYGLAAVAGVALLMGGGERRRR